MVLSVTADLDQVAFAVEEGHPKGPDREIRPGERRM
jgi:hypothetical protein